MLKEIYESNNKKIFSGDAIKDIGFLHKELSIDEDTLKFYPNWHFVGNQLCYFKEINDIKRLINELLGVYIARYFDLDSVSYELAYKKNGNKTGIISKCIFDKNKKYENLYELVSKEDSIYDASDCLMKINKMCQTNEERRRLYFQIIKMSIMDFYTHQVDRMYANINIQLKPSISLAPLYDYSETFDVRGKGEERKYTLEENDNWEQKQRYVYASDFLQIVFPSKRMYGIFNLYPEMYDYFLKILDFDIEKYLMLVEKENDISIPRPVVDNYLRYDEKQKEFVRKIK